MSLTRRAFFTTPAALGGIGLAVPHAANSPALGVAPLLVVHDGTRQGISFLSGAAAACAGLHRPLPQSLEISLQQVGAFARLQETLRSQAGALAIGLLEHGQMRLAEQALRACGAGVFFAADHADRGDAARHNIVINAGARPAASSKLLAEAASHWPFVLGQLLAGAPFSAGRQQICLAGERYSLTSFAAVL